MKIRLVELKGFGIKSQNSVIEQLNYYFDSKGKYLYAQILGDAVELVEILREELPDYRFELTGQVKRKLPIVEQIEILTDFDDSLN